MCSPPQNADRVLLLILLLPHFDGNLARQTESRKAAQAWLFPFNGASGENSELRVVCKHVHAAQGEDGIGMEIDMSPPGVNDGSAVKAYLAHLNDAAEPHDNIATCDVGRCHKVFDRIDRARPSVAPAKGKCTIL